MASEGGPYPVSPRRSSFDSDTHSDSPAKPLMHDIHNPAHKLNPWIIHPNHPRYVSWTYVINVFVFWSSFAAPYVWAMLPDPSLGYCIYEAVVGALFAVDMVMRLGFLAYVEKQKYTLVQDRKKIAIRYLRWGFWLDLASSIPFNLFWYIATGAPAGGRGGDVIRFLPCLRIYRLPQTFHIMSRLAKETFWSYLTLRIAKLTLIVVIGCHWAACLMHYTAYIEFIYSGDPEGNIFGKVDPNYFVNWSTFHRYNAAWYFSVNTGTSLGACPYMPVTTFERGWTLFYGMYSMALFAYAIGSLTLLLVKDTDLTGEYHSKLENLMSYAARTNLDPKIVEELRAYARMEMWLSKEKPWLRNVLPGRLGGRINRWLYTPLLEATYIFRGCSRKFISQLLTEVASEAYLPNTVLLQEGQVANHLYIVVSGTLVREDPTTGRPISAIGRGGVFGKVAVLMNARQLFTVRTTSLTTVLKLERDNFTDVLRTYPKDARQVYFNLKARVSPTNSPIHPAALEQRVMASQIQDLLVQHDIQIGSAACDAAAIGNLEALRQILQGHDCPDVEFLADSEGRTPLHLAAARGHVECIKTLINQGADVNAKDHLGATPLWEAIKSGHVASATALRNAGAELLLKDEGDVLCGAAAAGDIALLKRLLGCGVYVGARDIMGQTALHIASKKGNLPLARMLVAAGADPKQMNDVNKSPVDEAKALGDRLLQEFLER